MPRKTRRRAIPRVTQRGSCRETASAPPPASTAHQTVLPIVLLLKHSWARRDPLSIPTTPKTAPLLLSSLQSHSSSWLYLAEPWDWGWLHFSPPGSQPSVSAVWSPHIHTWHIILCLSIILPHFFHLHISLLIYNSHNLLSTVLFTGTSSLTHISTLTCTACSWSLFFLHLLFPLANF